MLPSQNARPSASRAHMYRRGKGRPWLIVACGVVAIVGGALALKWILGGKANGGGSEGSPPALTNISETSLSKDSPRDDRPIVPAPRTKAPIEKDAQQAEPKRDEPVKIAMGQSLPRSLDLDGEANANNHRAASARPPQATPESPEATPPSRSTPEPKVSPPPSEPTGNASTSPSSNAPASQRVQLAMDLISQNKPVEARKLLTDTLVAGNSATAEAARIRAELTQLNERLVFSPEVAAGDAFASAYQVAPGDSLAKIAKKLNLGVDWRFIQRINRISDPSKIRSGQRLKTIKGPFHLIIDKRTFVADLYLGDGSDRVYVRSFQVGLGEFGATPEGTFVVKPDSKLVNPAWSNPRTGEHFQPDDPKNPLGEYWIGLIGASDNIRGLETYGIHGTIDPDSIGKEMSMGCVRLLHDDVKLLYEVLTEPGSRIEIHGHDWP